MPALGIEAREEELMRAHKAKTALTNRIFLKGPRWREGRLACSGFQPHRITGFDPLRPRRR